MIIFLSPRRTLVLLLAVGLSWEAGQSAAATKNQKPTKADKQLTNQTIEIGDVGKGSKVEIKQIQGVDPKDHAAVIGMLAKRDADARKSEQRVVELEAELSKARASGVSRVLDQAAQPEADDLTRRARDALL